MNRVSLQVLNLLFERKEHAEYRRLLKRRKLRLPTRKKGDPRKPNLQRHNKK
jgi:hypothetical protein